MKRLAIIPARGGSKRIPRKNIKSFLGKPIIAYSIEAALKSDLFDEVMVSTDDDEISEIAKKYGASVPFMRSESNANDYATTADVLLEVLKEYDRSFDQACCIYPTAPLLRMARLKEGLELMEKEDFDTVFPIVEFSYPIWRSLKMDETQKVSMNWPENLNSRSQDLLKSYHDAGQFYWFDVDSFLKTKSLFTDATGSIIMKPEEVQDIDTIDDWKMAELKARLNQKD